MYICPVCKKKLKRKASSYSCKNNHCFDISSKGYVNLLTTKGRNPKTAGDNPLMVKARSEFLNKNYYLPLAEKISDIIKGLVKSISKPVIIDSGCGEGYYTAIYAQNISNAEIYGIDISKSAAAHCVFLCKEKNISNTEFAVASSFELPFRELTADLIVSTFAPVSNDEYARVLKKGRCLIIVSPAPKHLFGLKQVLYETPYENKPNSYGLKKFALEKQYTVDFNIQLDSNDDIMNLFKMTPYYYKTSESSVNKLKNLQKLDTPCEFFIDIYRKK